MVILAIWTPDCLENEHVKVHIDLVSLNKLDAELALVVCERAEFLILAWWSLWMQE